MARECCQDKAGSISTYEIKKKTAHFHENTSEATITAGECVIILRPSLIEKKKGDESLHTRDAWLFRGFLALRSRAVLFLLFSLLCFSPLTSLFIYVLFLLLFFFLWHSLSWDYCAAKLNEPLCNCLILCFLSAARHRCHSRQDRTVWNFCHHGPIHTFLEFFKMQKTSRRYFCGNEYLSLCI